MKRNFRFGRDYASTTEDWITCTCKKRGWATRRQAKVKMRELQKNDQYPLPLNVYRCRAGTTDLFHVGHRFPTPNLNDPRLKWIA